MPETTKASTPAAYLCLLLHAHLPFVRHPEHEEFLEEKWLFEAVRECYLPLIRVLRARAHRPPGSRIALSISPTLLAMLDDPLLRFRITRYLERVCRFAEAEIKRTSGETRMQPLAIFYQTLAEQNLQTWRDAREDLVSGFLQAGKNGQLELLTTAATHAFLPLWQRQPENIRRQIRIAVDVFARRTGYRPAGFWLPECGYYPGLEKHLGDEGLRYFMVEAHGLLQAEPLPPHGVYAPVACPNGVAVFGRDPDASRQVWSSREGYPGDSNYREYYRDIGRQIPREQLEKYFPLAGIDAATGFKYHRVTGATDEKDYYDPVRAARKAREHAADFISKKIMKAGTLAKSMPVPPVFTAPYDAELFGHWWFEGPLFLEELMNLCDETRDVAMITPSEYLDRHGGTMREAMPSASTWGARGYSGSWVNEATAWMYPLLLRAADDLAIMRAGASAAFSPEIQRRLLRQMARELLLAQSSDWPFMLNAGSHAAYAERRLRDHLARFYWIAGSLKSGVLDESRLSAIESADTVFTDDDLVSVE